jgi:hypothetical protein
MDGYPNRTGFSEGLVGAYAINDPKEITRFFGFDLKKAGVIPVQLSVQNNLSNDSITLTSATLLDTEGLLWEVLPSDVVSKRIDEHTSGGLSGENGARRSLLWGLAGGVLGAAVGVVSGTSVAESAAKGAAVGGAIGITTSIAQAGAETSDGAEIQRDFSTRSIDHATIAAGDTANGLLYFPGEVGQPRRLNLTFKTGSNVSKVELPL